MVQKEIMEVANGFILRVLDYSHGTHDLRQTFVFKNREELAIFINSDERFLDIPKKEVL
jgi:hypothetical protein